MLGTKYEGLRGKARERYNEKHEKLRDSLIEEYAEKKGAVKLYAQIKATEEKLKEQELELAQLGFYVYDDGDWRLDGKTGNSLKQLIDAQIEKQIGSLSAIDARFDSATLAMMTVASLQDAEKILKSVSEI